MSDIEKVGETEAMIGSCNVCFVCSNKINNLTKMNIIRIIEIPPVRLPKATW